MKKALASGWCLFLFNWEIIKVINVKVVIYAMTDRQKKFADKYIETMNATQSAKHAGYSERSAYSQGQRLLKNVEILNYIDQALKPGRDARIMSRDEALALMSDLARGDTKETITMFTGEGVQETVEIPTPVAVRKQALEHLLKRHDIADKDKLQLRKYELEIQKLEKELEDSGTTEDKMDDFLNKLNETIGTEGS